MNGRYFIGCNIGKQHRPAQRVDLLEGLYGMLKDIWMYSAIALQMERPKRCHFPASVGSASMQILGVWKMSIMACW